MSTTNNNFTVKSLVAKYRNYVDEHCDKVRECSEWQDENGECCYQEWDIPTSYSGEPDQQLIVTLYNTIAGKKAEKQVQDALSKYADSYFADALDSREFSFLKEHFAEVVSLCLSGIEMNNMDFCKSSQETIDIIQNTPKPEDGKTVFIAQSGRCDIATLFPGCIIKGFTSYTEHKHDKENWALGQIRLFSLGIVSEIKPFFEECLKEEYIADVDYVVWGAAFHSRYNDIDMMYRMLRPNGKMFVFTDKKEVAGTSSETYNFRKIIVKEKSISHVVSYEENDGFFARMQEKVFLCINKRGNNQVHIENSLTKRSKEVPSDRLDAEILWPSYYFTTSPKDGIALSEIVRFVDLEERTVIKNGEKGEWVLPGKIKRMPVVLPARLTDDYKDANLLEKDLNLAGDPFFDDKWKFWIRTIKECCVLLYGNKDKTVVGYIKEMPESGIATLDSIVCLVPKNGYDVRYIAALLLIPEIKNQIISVCDGDINDRTFPLIMNKVIVPNHSDKERLEFLSEVNYEALKSSQKELKKEHQNYTKAVRMRKHALTQSLSSIEALFYALNEYRIRQSGCLKNEDVISRVQGTTVKDAFEFLSTEIKELMPVLDHIADVEYSFAKPESIDPEEFIEEYISKENKSWLNFSPVITWPVGGNKRNFVKKEENGPIVIAKGKPLNTFVFPKDALEKIFNNILSNAKAYAFTDDYRKDYQLRFSWRSDGVSLVIEIENNGTPIPEDRDTASLLEYGVSTSLHQDGHNGIGCNEIKDIMSRYDGDVKIISSPNEEYTVKYVLIFNNSYTYIPNRI